MGGTHFKTFVERNRTSPPSKDSNDFKRGVASMRRRYSTDKLQFAIPLKDLQPSKNQLRFNDENPDTPITKLLTERDSNEESWITVPYYVLTPAQLATLTESDFGLPEDKEKHSINGISLLRVMRKQSIVWSRAVKDKLVAAIAEHGSCMKAKLGKEKWASLKEDIGFLDPALNEDIKDRLDDCLRVCARNTENGLLLKGDPVLGSSGTRRFRVEVNNDNVDGKFDEAVKLMSDFAATWTDTQRQTLFNIIASIPRKSIEDKLGLEEDHIPTQKTTLPVQYPPHENASYMPLGARDVEDSDHAVDATHTSNMSHGARDTNNLDDTVDKSEEMSLDTPAHFEPSGHNDHLDAQSFFQQYDAQHGQKKPKRGRKGNSASNGVLQASKRIRH